MQHVLLSGCDCNTVGTISGSTSCADETGDSCSCSGTDGYSGGLSGKCDDCLDGWYWTSSDSTCTSCDCNTVGTIGGSSSCADETGDSCSCSGTDGYSGGLSGKCDDCLDGWYWTSSDSTCTSKYLFTIKLRIRN